MVRLNAIRYYCCRAISDAFFRCVPPNSSSDVDGQRQYGLLEPSMSPRSMWRRLLYVFPPLPYLLCFLAGGCLSALFMLGFDSVKPCGKSLGNTVLNVFANLTKLSWNTTKSKYVVHCPRYPPDFVGKLRFPLETMPSFEELNRLYEKTFTKDPQIGGHFQPSWCRAIHSVAIIVPYRNREENLRGFLFYLHQIMQRQLHDYAIFIVEQAGAETTRFNRGVLLNIGFLQAMETHDFDCVIFYDVDKIPEDDRNSHACPSRGHVRHMAAYQHRFERMTFRDDYFGGVLAMTSHDVKLINGFSNVFFGYGYEDDEFLHRIKLRNMTIYREHLLHTKYWNLGHAGDGVIWSEFDWKHENERLLHSTAERMERDGLNSIAHEGLTVKRFPTYTLVTAVISEKAILKKMSRDYPATFKVVEAALGLESLKSESRVH